MNRSSQKNPMLRVMGLRNFQLLFSGAATSLLGDQFALIATPWLVLNLTSDPLALGTVLALEGIPRAVFMLVGGAITDRISPRRVMLAADFTRLALTALMAVAIFTGVVQIWMLYAFGLGFGLVAGFAVPAENSIVPLLVKDDDLQAGNSLMMGVGQLVGFVGPTVAGILIGAYAQSELGIGLAFALDALSFAVSAICLLLIHMGSLNAHDDAQSAGAEEKESVPAAILAGVNYLWANRTERMMFLMLVAINFLLIGPLLVGLPVIANSRLAEGAVAFGLLTSAFSGGNLVGILLAGALPRPSSTLMRAIVIAMIAGFGIVVGLLGLITSTWLDFALMLLIGLGNGYIAILMFTWVQTHTPKEMLGRMMSILMFSNTGLVPISQAISGAVLRWNPNLLFFTAGGLVLLVTAWMAFQPELKEFSQDLVVRPEAKGGRAAQGSPAS